jgi:cellulose 1,4-beta-cellobiosidase
MKGYLTLVASLLSAVGGTPFENIERNVTSTSVTENPFQGVQIYANSFYAKEVDAAVTKIGNPGLAAKAKKVATIPSFYWL